MASYHVKMVWCLFSFIYNAHLLYKYIWLISLGGHGYVCDEFLAGLVFRMTSSNNYNIFYVFYENNDVVQI